MTRGRTIGYHSDAGHEVHDVPGHPERPDRVLAINAAVDATGLRDRLASLPDRVADEAELRLVHQPGLVEALRRLDAAGGA
jgi:acetoin utilization deacetylase AcuC-like enzyme